MALTATGNDAVVDTNHQSALQVYKQFLGVRFDATRAASTKLPDCNGDNAVLGLAYVARYAVEYIVENEDATLLNTAQSLKIPSAKEDHLAQVLFSILGWTSLLYTPSPKEQIGSLNITEEGFRCFERTELAIYPNLRRPITENLNSFGITLPDHDSHGESAASTWSLAPLDVANLNAALLESFGIEIVWTTCLTAHLTFKKSERQLYLFGMPSFCVLHNSKRDSVTIA